MQHVDDTTATSTGDGPCHNQDGSQLPWIEQMLGAPLDSTAMADVLEEIDNGVLVCSEIGRVVMANDAGRRELNRGNPLTVDADGWLLVTGDDGTGTAHCRSALRAAVETRRRQLLALDDGTQRLMVAVTPLGQSAKPWALLLLGRRQPAPDLAVEMLGMLCDLTHSERSVLVALIEGQRVESIARCRGVAIATVRSQVGALRAKLGASRIEDFVRMAAVLPPIASALRTPGLGGHRHGTPEGFDRLGATAATASYAAAAG